MVSGRSCAASSCGKASLVSAAMGTLRDLHRSTGLVEVFFEFVMKSTSLVSAVFVRFGWAA